jgi:hypothetical protein
VAEKVSDKNRYPQIPSTVWWGVRAILHKTPKAVLNDQFLKIHLSVQEAAAKQYVAELVAVGLLDEDNKATPLAQEWRLDPSYGEAVEKLIARNYPQTLRDLAPHAEGDREKATSFFMSGGLGRGTAGNKAATYFMIGAAEPNESPARPTTTRTPKTEAGAMAATLKDTRPQKNVSRKVRRAEINGGLSGSGNQPSLNAIPLNVNVQIHISADAGTEQIEAIFSAMKRYLYDKQTA